MIFNRLAATGHSRFRQLIWSSRSITFTRNRYGCPVMTMILHQEIWNQKNYHSSASNSGLCCLKLHHNDLNFCQHFSSAILWSPWSSFVQRYHITLLLYDNPNLVSDVRNMFLNRNGNKIKLRMFGKYKTSFEVAFFHGTSLFKMF